MKTKNLYTNPKLKETARIVCDYTKKAPQKESDEKEETTELDLAVRIYSIIIGIIIGLTFSYILYAK